MESNNYNEVVHICKALDAMIDHMEIVINELPDVLLMANKVIPNRMKEVASINKEMIEKIDEIINQKEYKRTLNKN